MAGQDENAAIRMASDGPVFIADGDLLAHGPPPFDELPRSADAYSASIVELLAASYAADIEFEPPQSGRLFRAAKFP